MSLAAEQVDRILRPLQDVLGATNRPKTGWIRAIRESLGMTTSQMAERMGVKQPRICEIEKAEPQGAVTLQSMERAAEALGCRFVYFLVPREPLTKSLETQADKLADKRLAHVIQTMKLEGQEVTPSESLARMRRQLKDKLILSRGKLWADE